MNTITDLRIKTQALERWGDVIDFTDVYSRRTFLYKVTICWNDESVNQVVLTATQYNGLKRTLAWPLIAEVTFNRFVERASLKGFQELNINDYKNLYL